MATLLGTWELGGGYGHIAHLAPLAEALKARGHAMLLAARNPKLAATAPGQPFAGILRPPLDSRPPRRGETLTYGAVIADAGFDDPAVAIALVRGWLDIFAAVKPAAIAAEHAPMSLLAAHVAGIDAVMFGAGWVVPPATRPLPSLMPWRNASEAELAAADSAADAVVRAVCAAFGAPKLDGIADLVGRSRRYLTTLPEIDPYGPRPGATYYGVMSGFRAPAAAPWPAGSGLRVFAYLPFSHAAAPGLTAALGALGWPTVWHFREPPDFELPANIAFASAPVDVAETLADCDLLVSRGGHATACEALLAGRRTLLLPDTLDTILVARRLNMANLGLGTTATEVGELREKLETLVADPTVTAMMAATRARYATYRADLAAAQLADAMIRDLAL